MRDILFTGVTEGSADGQEALAGFTAQRLQVGTHISWQPQDFDQILCMSVACNTKADCLLSCLSDLAVEIQCDAGYASHGQRLHFHIPAHTSSLQIQSICGDGELWIVSEGVLQAKLYVADLSQEQCVQEAEHVLQTAAICQLSWMGGCVLDGLRALSQSQSQSQNADKQIWQAAQESWLSHYLHAGTLHYQLPNGAPIENAFTNIESALPVACIA
ncbi:MAG: hypothetical protein HRU15_11485, partial [Planctomycetes bacterium]|nr:hypothetical protein [Planctomycetota bacterium]